MASIALIAHRSPDAVEAYRAGVAASARILLAHGARLAASMPGGGHVLNVCDDRYKFTVAFAASVLTRKMSLLPSTHTPQIIRQLAQLAPDVFCMTDDPDCDIDLPQFHYPEARADSRMPRDVP